MQRIMFCFLLLDDIILLPKPDENVSSWSNNSHFVGLKFVMEYICNTARNAKNTFFSFFLWSGKRNLKGFPKAFDAALFSSSWPYISPKVQQKEQVWTIWRPDANAISPVTMTNPAKSGRVQKLHVLHQNKCKNAINQSVRMNSS